MAVSRTQVQVPGQGLNHDLNQDLDRGQHLSHIQSQQLTQTIAVKILKIRKLVISLSFDQIT